MTSSSSSSSQSPDPIERLLAERTWVRRLAHALVADPADADDLTQQTYVAALERPPAGLRSPRAWLGTVVRNLAGNRRREIERRRARERAAARPPSQGSVPDTVARAETAERVAALVLALDEPYRSTVLLRYFEEEPPRRIAAQMGVPVETVRTRLKRALAKLRRQLDDAHRGDGRSWLGALLPVAEIGRGGTTASALAWGGGLLVSQTVRITALGLVLAALATLTWHTLREDEPASLDQQATPTHLGVRAGDEGAVAAQDAPTLAGSGSANAGSSAEAEGSKAVAFSVRGRVLRPGRFPASDVEVRLRLDGTPFARARTDEGGTYRVPVPEGALDGRTTCTVVARSDDGRVALGCRSVPRTDGADAWLRELVLGEAHVLAVRVTRGGEDVPHAHVQLAAEGLGMRGLLLRKTTDARGRLRIPDLPACVYRLSATAPGTGRAARFVRVPEASQGGVTLTLGGPRTLEVRVVAGPEARPLEGIELGVLETLRRLGGGASTRSYEPRLSIPPTGADGRTRIEGVSEGEALSVMVLTAAWRSVEGFPTPTGDGWRYGVEVEPERDHLTIALPEKRTVVWPLVDGEVRAPEEGTEVRLELEPNSFLRWAPPTAVVSDGRLVVSGLLPGAIALRAFAPAGTRARLVAKAGEDVGNETAFHRPRVIRLVGSNADGEPLEGYRVVAGAGQEPGSEATLDADGRGTLEGLWPTEALRLYLREPGTTHAPLVPLDEVDLRERDASFVFTFSPEEEHQLLLRVLTGGRARLPDTYHLYVEPGRVALTEEDPDAGTIALRWRMEGERDRVRLSIEAPGWLPWWTWLTPDTRTASVRLDASAEIELRVHPPADGRYRTSFRRLDASTRTWGPAGGRRSMGRTSSSAELDVSVSERLPAGTYKVLDWLSGLETGEIDVASGARATLELDLSKVVALRGRVVAPAGTDLALARVRLGAEPGTDPADAARVRADGSFELRTLAGEVRALHVWHPLLPAAEEGGTVTVTAPRDDIRLNLAEVSTVVWTFAPKEHAVRSPRRFRFLLFAGEAVGTPDHVLQATVSAKGERLEATLGAVPPGRWTVWVDPGSYAPLLLEDQVLAKPPIRPVPLTLGGGVRAKVLLPAGGEDPVVLVTATRDDPDHPSYERTEGEQGREQTVRGLGPGRFRVQVVVWRDVIDDENPPGLEETLEVREGEIVERVIDLR